jgi:hypothetical protein
MSLQETIRRVLKEELSPRVRRRIAPDEMENDFLESFEFAYNLTKKRKILSSHFLEELIYTTISVMMDGFHWRFTSTIPEDEFWYDDIHKELENHYRDRITQMYNERRGINESILREETQIPLPIIRRVTNSDIEESFLISLDRIDDERRYSKMSVMKNISLQTFAKMVIDDMVTELEFGYFSDENRIYFDNDETYHDEIRVPLMNYFADKIKKRYSEFID